MPEKKDSPYIKSRDILVALIFSQGLIGLSLFQTKIRPKDNLQISDFKSLEQGEFQDSVFDQGAHEVVVPDGGRAQMLIAGVKFIIDDFKLNREKRRFGGARIVVNNVDVFNVLDQTIEIPFSDSEVEITHKSFGTIGELMQS